MHSLDFAYNIANLQGQKAALNGVIVSAQESIRKIDKQIAILCDNTKETYETYDKFNRSHEDNQ